jgi:hypothetical protein
VPLYVNTFFEKRVEQLFDLAARVESAFAAASLDYRVVGGLATYLYVEDALPDAGRLTRDIDIAVRREDIARIAAAVEPYGLYHRHVAGIDMLVQADEPTARRAVHLIFTGEKVRPEYADTVPDFGDCPRIKGIRLVPLADLVRMKLTSFRLKDQTHLKDIEEAGLITPAIEAGLPESLRTRLAQIRSSE